METSAKRSAIAGGAVLVLGLILVVYFVRATHPPESENINLFYYSPILDVEPGTTILRCSSAGLVPVPRTIQKSGKEIKDAITLLLAGPTTAEKRTRGVTSDFPLPGFKLTSYSLQNGILTLNFDDPRNQTSGGTCRVSVLWAQIEATAKQFPGVKEVRFSPATLFQP